MNIPQANPIHKRDMNASRSTALASFVAQVFNLLFRRFLTCGGANQFQPAFAHARLPIENRRYSRLKICATGPWQRGPGRTIASMGLWIGLGAALLLLGPTASAQHLWWDLAGQRDATCLYGEITVLATHPAIYYCGANWHPGQPAGGYCGIQDNSAHERRTIFSIWDTTPQLHPRVTEADPDTLFGRFGGEGEGGHTHMLWPWNTNETFQFFVQKQPGTDTNTTDARYYIFDRKAGKWRHSATINSPNGGHASVATLGGGMTSFLENFLGRDRDLPKLALYRLWLGPSPDKMKCLTTARGDGTWGELHDSYFLAEGKKEALDAVFASLEKEYGKPVFGARREALPPLEAKPVPPAVVEALKNLPRAQKAKAKTE
jgi:hypothetical protein